jgi:hypothetical protein
MTAVTNLLARKRLLLEQLEKDPPDAVRDALEGRKLCGSKRRS